MQSPQLLLFFFLPPNISSYKIRIIIRHTQVLFTWWVRTSSYSCCLETVLIQLIANHSVSTLTHIINSMAQSPRQHQTTSTNPAYNSAIMDASCRLSLLLDARSKFSISINHRVSNGMLPFRMRPITEGAAVSAVGEAALIAWIHSQLWSHCRCLLIVVIMANGGG